MMDVTDHAILSTLADGNWHSGEDIARDIQLSHAALAKRINKLADSDFGLDLDRRHGRGYRIAGGLGLLHDSAGNPKPALQSISGLHLLRECSSTSDWLTAHPDAECVLAEYQSAGRGRRGRTWLAPYGKNLLLSLRCRFDHWPDGLSALSLVIGLGIVRHLNSLGIPAGIKWPNDIWLKNSKLGGLLIETRGEASSGCELIIGCGMNLQMQAPAVAPASPANNDYHWTSLTQAGFSIDRPQFAANIIRCIRDSVAEFAQQGPASALQDFSQWDVFSNQDVEIHEGDKQFAGRCGGVNSSGALVLHLSDGQSREFWVGDVSLRPQSTPPASAARS